MTFEGHIAYLLRSGANDAQMMLLYPYPIYDQNLRFSLPYL